MAQQHTRRAGGAGMPPPQLLAHPWLGEHLAWAGAALPFPPHPKPPSAGNSAVPGPGLGRDVMLPQSPVLGAPAGRCTWQ